MIRSCLSILLVFFAEIERDVSETILKACGITTRSRITNLIDRYLLSIGSKSELKMHQLVQEIGRVEGKGNVLGLSLDMHMLDKEKLGASFESIPLDLPMMNLIALDMSYSYIESFVGCYSNTQRLEKRQKFDDRTYKTKSFLEHLRFLI
uniref:Disease resistance protein Roq1-like winged-helix domain-containing protein n=1 Tax=Lactuca sativa TaxID=4236 RepID=A0A9R1XUD3_LACSA|nr:hypothetical protein LSAT_V11C100037630 [Lactuca sativa]